MIVICCGMSRSGSTVQYQIVKEILERNDIGRGEGLLKAPNLVRKYANSPNIHAIKSEQPIPEALELFLKDPMKIVCFGIYRDFRDVFVSLMNFFSARKQHFGNRVDLTGSFDEVLAGSGRQAIAWQTWWESTDMVMWFRYSIQHASNFVPMIATVGMILTGDPLPSNQIVDIGNQFDRNKQLQRIQHQKAWISDKTMLTRGHISKNAGKPGAYKMLLTDEQLCEVEKLGGKWLLAHGYKLETDCG